MLYDEGSAVDVSAIDVSAIDVSAVEMAAARMTPALDAEGGTGATALLHGILATLSEALERLDRRLGVLETATEGRLARVEDGLAALTEALRAASEDDEDTEPDDGREELLHALDATAGRIEAVIEAVIGTGLRDLRDALPEPPQPDDSREVLLHALDATAGRIEAVIGTGLRDLRDALPEPPEPDDGAATRALLRDELDHLGRSLHDEVERVGVLVRGQVAEVSGQAASVAAVLGRLDGRIHDLVDGVRAAAQQARFLRLGDAEPEPATELSALS